MAGKAKKSTKHWVKSYRLVVSDKDNFTEVYATGISKLKLGLVVGALFSIGVGFAVVLLFFTPLKQLVPGYPSHNLREKILYNSMMIDSLEHEITTRDNYLEQIRAVILSEVIEEGTNDVPEQAVDVELEEMDGDSIFDSLLDPNKYRFTNTANVEDFDNISRLSFFTPVNGFVINRFNALSGHLGTDIVSDEYSHIASVLDGTVIFAEWSVSTGYVVQIQHNHNLVSVYKHNSDIFVKSGDQVKSGDIIAVMGDEGELSTGPHLHFELWQNGVPLNAQEYIDF